MSLHTLSLGFNVKHRTEEVPKPFLLFLSHVFLLDAAPDDAATRATQATFPRSDKTSVMTAATGAAASACDED